MRITARGVRAAEPRHRGAHVDGRHVSEAQREHTHALGVTLDDARAQPFSPEALGDPAHLLVVVDAAEQRALRREERLEVRVDALPVEGALRRARDEGD